MALKKMKSGNFLANHYDILTGEEYWISGVKKDGKDRHWAGAGKIMMDSRVISDYLNLVEADCLDKNKFQIVEITSTDKEKFKEVENQKLNE